MRRFSFRLATLLRVRERALDSAASELRRVEAEVDSTRQYLERVRQEQVRVEEETHRMIGGSSETIGPPEVAQQLSPADGKQPSSSLTAAELRERRTYTEFLRQQLEMAQRRLSTLSELRDEKRRTWRERRRDWKAVQKVLERERSRWQSKEMSEEQKVIDEIAQNVSGAPSVGATDGESHHAGGSAFKAVLVVILVLALSGVMLYSLRLVGEKRIAFLDSGIMLGPASVESKPQSFEVAGKVSSATPGFEPTPTAPESVSMLITSDMIEETLQQVNAERARLQDREAMLDAWEERLNRKQQEVEQLISRYDALREQIEADLAEQRALRQWRESEERKQREANIKRLAQLYEKTRAREAAFMMLELEKEQAQEVLLAMDERQAVKILGEMSRANPKRATELLESISEEPGRLAPAQTPAP